MRDDGENARPQFGLKTVHHRQHDDQRRNAQRDAAHRDQRDEGNEVVVLLGARIAQADQQLVGKGHQRQKLISRNRSKRQNGKGAMLHFSDNGCPPQQALGCE
jgi:hypothetical protein